MYQFQQKESHMSAQTQESLFDIAYAMVVIVSFVYWLWVLKVTVGTRGGGSLRDLPRGFYLGLGLTAILAALIIPLAFKDYVGPSVTLPFLGVLSLATYAVYSHEKPKPTEEN
jgi:hypothetical protein